MKPARYYPSLIKLFAASAIGLGVTGCASIPGTAATGCMEETKSNVLFLISYTKREFNRDCALKDIADKYSQSTDDGEKVLGQHLREKFDPEIKAKADQTREEATGKTAPYKVGEVEVKDGRKTFILVPVPKEKSPVTPAPASAPAP